VGVFGLAVESEFAAAVPRNGTAAQSSRAVTPPTKSSNPSNYSPSAQSQRRHQVAQKTRAHRNVAKNPQAPSPSPAPAPKTHHPPPLPPQDCSHPLHPSPRSEPQSSSPQFLARKPTQTRNSAPRPRHRSPDYSPLHRQKSPRAAADSPSSEFPAAPANAPPPSPAANYPSRYRRGK